jgi:hypothetical protein
MIAGAAFAAMIWLSGLAPDRGSPHPQTPRPGTAAAGAGPAGCRAWSCGDRGWLCGGRVAGAALGSTGDKLAAANPTQSKRPDPPDPVDGPGLATTHRATERHDRIEFLPKNTTACPSGLPGQWGALTKARHVIAWSRLTRGTGFGLGLRKSPGAKHKTPSPPHTFRGP